jgi:muramoyltetrapeptide carboxypeptidase
VGGNLSLLVSALGSKYEIDTRGKLLLLEDIEEEPYQVDRKLNQLRLAGKLSEAAGFVVGDFAKSEPKKRKDTLSLEKVLQHYLGNLGKPAVSGFNCHRQPHCRATRLNDLMVMLRR